MRFEKPSRPSRFSQIACNPRCLVFAICAACLLVVSAEATITEIQPLDFGTIALSSSVSTRTLEISPGGGIFPSSGVFIVTAGQAGRFDLTNFPPNTLLFISVSDGDLTQGGVGTGDAFTVSNYRTDPLPITDGTGSYTLRLGATLEADSGVPVYSDTTFSDSVTLTVNF